MTDFIPGQRWISNTEAELGLGVITCNQDRRVTLHFPASDEERTYATDNAPLSRVEYPVGESIRNAAGVTITIEERIEKNGCLIYIGTDEAGDTQVIPELELDSSVQFSRPQDRLFAGQIDKLSRYRLRLDTLHHQHRLQQSAAYGLLGARVQCLPHQMYIAHEVAHRYAPRVLLADEVGLGKTIEAGLILHQQLISGRAQRVLITVPDSLVYQWLVEMLRRFNLRFSVMDELRCSAAELSGSDNPFESAQLILCGQEFIEQHPNRVAQILQCQWDMLIVDEAHHLIWSETGASELYQTIEALARQIPSLLLLTATPEQLGVASHFARLRLLDPDRYSDLQHFIQEQHQYGQINQLVQRLQQPDSQTQLTQDSALRAQLDTYLGADFSTRLSHDDATLDDAIEQLLDRHGTGRVLFRNTRDSVSGFPTRRLQRYPLTTPLPLEPHDDLAQALAPEQLFGETWLQDDPRVHWLEGWLKEHKLEKTLLICADANTAQTLDEFLRLRKGVRCSVFHEKMSLINRDRAAAYFADADEYAQLLICSEIGSEGRNFQFANHLIMFDLPLNPDLLEQRIGRLDRIGHQGDVHIHVPYLEGSAQEVLLRWLDEGINAFCHTCPAGQILLEQFAPELTSLLLDGADELAFEQLLSDTRQQTEQLHRQLQGGRDKLLEMNACRPAKAEAVLQAVQQTQQTDALLDYMERAFDQFGIDQQEDSDQTVILHPTDQMLYPQFPGLPDDGCRATYQRERALAREDLHYLSWEHPIVRGAMELINTSEFGNTAVCTIKLPPLPPGTMLVESIFTLYCTAPRALNISAYQSQASVRILLDNQGNDLSHIISAEHLHKLGQRVKRHAAQNLIRHGRSQIATLLEQAQAQAQHQQQDWIAQATAKAQHQLQDEIDRLNALMAVNPAIRPDEMAQLQHQQTDLMAHLSQAKLKMDAVRIAVVSD